jgi:hypothetical protein
MMVTVLTACTSRKVVAAADDLRMRAVPKGNLDDVARDWTARINAAAPTIAAADLYAGRDYRRLATVVAPKRPYVLSAGLGLLAPETRVPSYDATVAAGVEDSVYARASGRFTPRDWFIRLQGRSRLAMPVRRLPSDGLIIAALPARYLAMIADDLVRLGPERIRLFTGSDRAVPQALLGSRMPYDGLLSDIPGYDGPLVGFAERALCHFMEAVLAEIPDATREDHAAAVSRGLRAAHG